MTEADELSDKIAIMALGRVRAIGSKDHLKERYGRGMHINVVAKPENAAHVKECITDIAPCILTFLVNF